MYENLTVNSSTIQGTFKLSSHVFTKFCPLSYLWFPEPYMALKYVAGNIESHM